MSYLVIACDTCQTVALAAIPSSPAHLQACEGCQQPLRIVPTRMFQEDERALFAELSASVAQAGLSSMDAHTLSRFVARALTDKDYTAHWEELTTRLPALLPRQQVMGGNRQALTRSLQLLQTIFDAFATSRSSGVVSMPSADTSTRHLA